MLENPWMLRYSSYDDNCVREHSERFLPFDSDNSSAAENQQERLIKIGWITGFVDGEGCFSINFIRQPHRVNRRGYTTGFQVAHEFAVTQGAKSVEVLYTLLQFFGVGGVYINRRYDNHKEHVYRYCVRKRDDLALKIVPFFRRYPLQTSKQGDFLKFAECLRLMESNSHLTRPGLIEMIKIAETMNHCKPRTEIIRILRDYTPNADSKSVKI
jgi:LAGLIDADG endonuclease